MLKILFLDDSIQRHFVFRERMKGCEIHHCTLPLEALNLLKQSIFGGEASTPYDFVYLDHDLGFVHTEYMADLNKPANFEINSKGLVDWICKNVKPEQCRQTKFIIHSWNLPAAKSMKLKLDEYDFYVALLPFSHFA